MIEIKLVEHKDDIYPQLLELRNEVLRIPLGLSIYNDDLTKDEDAAIVVAQDGDKLIGCVLLQPIEDGVLKLRAMAVAPEYQGEGIGKEMVEFAEGVAKEMGAGKMVLNARITATGFYEKLGYHREGEIFTEVTIPHMLMQKMLA